MDTRFGNDPQVGPDGPEDPWADGRYAVQSYLEHQGDKFVRRFDAGSYVILTESLNRHDVGRGRGGVEKALRSCPVPVVVGGITSDRLYPLRLQEELADLLPGCTGLRVVESVHGHDAFLIEFEAVSELVRKRSHWPRQHRLRKHRTPRERECRTHRQNHRFRSVRRQPPTNEAGLLPARGHRLATASRSARRPGPGRRHRQAHHPPGGTRTQCGRGRPPRGNA